MTEFLNSSVLKVQNSAVRAHISFQSKLSVKWYVSPHQDSGWTSLVAQTVKRLPTMRETRVQSLGQEDLLEKEMATHSSILAWKIPWTEKPGRLLSMGLQRVRHD